jgi:hypothetical protein
MEWKKSTRGTNNGQCVEVAPQPDGTVCVRDSKDPGPELRLSPAMWSALLEAVKRGEWDLPAKRAA